MGTESKHCVLLGEIAVSNVDMWFTYSVENNHLAYIPPVLFHDMVHYISVGSQASGIPFVGHLLGMENLVDGLGEFLGNVTLVRADTPGSTPLGLQEEIDIKFD